MICRSLRGIRSRGVVFEVVETNSTTTGKKIRSFASSSPSSETGREEILQRRENGVLAITLNRPRKRNALNRSMLLELESILKDLRISSENITSPSPPSSSTNDSVVRAVVIQANGPAFCSGHDLVELQQMTSNQHEDLFRLCSRVMAMWQKIPQPTIAAVHGVASAAGCQLAAATDLTICTEDAKFITPGVNIGFFCSTPAVPLLRCLPRKVAMDMLLTGRILTAQEALQFGLVSRMYAQDKEKSKEYTTFEEDEGGRRMIHKQANQLAVQIASKSSATVSLGKLALDRQQASLDQSIDAAYQIATDAMIENLNYRDAQHGIGCFLNAKEEPVWEHK